MSAPQAGEQPGPAAPPSLATARTVVEALVAGGVRHVVVSPGSRSAPFTPVLADAERAGALSVRVVLDERSAGYVALGIARAALAAGERRPAAVVTTSGTAVANLHPAVAEADAAGVPLVVVSADRPHELVGTGANQTTEQTGLFGRALRAMVDLPADMPADLGQDAAPAVAGQVRRVVAAACGTLSNDPGPAQLNVRLRPPLAGSPGTAPFRTGRWAPPARHASRSCDTVPLASGAGDRQGPESPAPSGSAGPPRTACCRGLVVVGDCVDGAGRLGRVLAELLGWPLMAEPTSGARGGPLALARYAELLGSPGGRALAGRTEHVVVVGHPSLSRSVSALLARADLTVDVLTTSARWTDVAGTASQVVPVTGQEDPGGLAAALDLGQAPDDWALAWHRAAAALPAGPRLSPGLAAPDRLTAEAAALAVWEAQSGVSGRQGPRTVLGSSMTIRHLDRFAPAPAGVAPHPLANRGLAGIDGTLATALGVHVGGGSPVRVVVGDLTFLHDAMSLGRGARESEPDLQVVVLDDSGGAIFSTLEYPAVTPREDFERFFTTPQATAIPDLARALGASVHESRTPADLRELLARPVQGLSVLHVQLVR